MKSQQIETKDHETELTKSNKHGAKVTYKKPGITQCSKDRKKRETDRPNMT